MASELIIYILIAISFIIIIYFFASSICYMPDETSKYISTTKGLTRTVYFNYVDVVSHCIAPFLVPDKNYFYSEKNISNINAIFMLGMVDELSDKMILLPDEHYNFFIGSTLDINNKVKKKNSLFFVPKQQAINIHRYTKGKYYNRVKISHAYITGQEFNNDLLEALYKLGRQLTQELNWFSESRIDKLNTEAITRIVLHWHTLNIIPELGEEVE